MRVDGNGEFTSKFKSYREFEKFTLEVCKLGFQREIGTEIDDYVYFQFDERIFSETVGRKFNLGYKMKELNESTKPVLSASQKSQLVKLERKLDALARMAGRDDIGRMVYGGIRDEYSNLVYYYQGKDISPMRDFRGMYRDFERLGVGRKTNTDFSNLVYEIGDELSAYIQANINNA